MSIYIVIKFVLFLDYHLANWASYWGIACIREVPISEIKLLDQLPQHEHSTIKNVVYVFIIESSIDYHEVGQPHKRNVRKYLQV
jgi:hypothetical protein